MNALLALASTSLADPLASSPLADAVAWIEGAMLGTLANAVAVLAVGIVGIMMLAGRLNLKRGATVILGCFILFGAPSITAGILNAPARLNEPPRLSEASPYPPMELPTPITTQAYDPYAGASLQPR